MQKAYALEEQSNTIHEILLPMNHFLKGKDNIFIAGFGNCSTQFVFSSKSAIRIIGLAIYLT